MNVKVLCILAVAGLTSTALLSGCTKASAEELLLGTWTLDLDAMKKTAGDDPQMQMMIAMLGSAKMELTFTKDKVIMNGEMMGQKQKDEHPYRVKSSEGNTLVLTSTEKNEDITVVVDGDNLTFTTDKGQSFSMKRK